jgi:hypothetical protein
VSKALSWSLKKGANPNPINRIVLSKALISISILEIRESVLAVYLEVRLSRVRITVTVIMHTRLNLT